MNFEQHASRFRSERAVHDAGRTAGVRVLREPLLRAAVLADPPKLALDDVDFLPELVHQGLGADGAWSELHQTRATAAFTHFVQIAGENFRFESWGEPFRRVPAVVHIYWLEAYVVPSDQV